MHKGHGNTHAQRKRRRRYLVDMDYKKEEYELIDGNITHYPYAWCDYHKGWLTKTMAVTHNCENKAGGCCKRLKYDDI